jgi:hypothetical protein
MDILYSRGRIAELFLKGFGKVCQSFKADLETYVGCFPVFIADFIERYVQPFFYQPFLRRQV